MSFQWNHFPALESILLTNMAEYYSLSSTKNQTTDQTLFNDELVAQIYRVIKKHNWILPDDMPTNRLRDRVRCYFKTLIQNAKKRLHTMLRDYRDAEEQLREMWAFCLGLKEVNDWLSRITSGSGVKL
jgi:hypothetical protein